MIAHHLHQIFSKLAQRQSLPNKACLLYQYMANPDGYWYIHFIFDPHAPLYPLFFVCDSIFLAAPNHIPSIPVVGLHLL